MRAFRRGVGLVAAVALLALTPAAATASSRWFTDQYGDVATSVDIHRVHLINGTAQVPGIKVLISERRLLGGDQVLVWFDTNPGDPGPEFRADWLANTDAGGLRRVESFAKLGAGVHCPGMIIRADQFAPGEYSYIVLPRPCLSSPSAVRVNVRTQRGVVKDWAPSAQHFYAWISRG